MEPRAIATFLLFALAVIAIAVIISLQLPPPLHELWKCPVVCGAAWIITAILFPLVREGKK